MKKKIKIIILYVLSVIIILTLGFLVFFRIYVVPGIQELTMTETIKGEWIGIQDFVKAKGHYPNDINELSAYYNYKTDKDEMTYIKPNDFEDKDDVILWWNKKSYSGLKIGIRKSGLVEKVKDKRKQN